MRYFRIAALFILNFLLIATVSGQTPKQTIPVPGDPLELATGPALIADTPDKRASILALLERARQNNNLHAMGISPFDLKVSFNSNGPSLYSGGGDLEETWVSRSTWKWTAHLGTYSQARIFYRGLAYDLNPHAYLPLRLQMVRQAIFWPVSGNFANDVIRVAASNWNGKAITCALIAGPRAEATSAPGRQSNEEEFCIDPTSGLLQTYSIAPGIYDVYDYTDALKFHGRNIARRISIIENGSAVLQVQLNDIADLNTTDVSLFTPGPEMKGPGVMIGGPMRFPQVVKKDSALSSAGVVQPVIIHAALDADGKVLEAEALQSPGSPLSEAALELVKNTNYGRTRSGIPLERDVFINVQFVSPQ